MDKNKAIEKVKEQILDAEKTGDYSKIDSSLCKKRLEWLEEHINDVKEESLVKKTYILLLIKKIEIEPSEVPVVYEDNKKIVWQSFNWCPVLEACKELGIDTRKVCKNGYENSVVKFVQRINPKLKFSRNYEILRPHGQYCEETIKISEISK